MPTVIILGMHRSGTSLVAKMLMNMGVDMGAEFLGPHISQPLGHWEDSDFVRMSNDVLASAVGTWKEPQEIDWYLSRPEVAMLVTLKQHPELAGGEKRESESWWGWKDPRSCLTIGAFHQYLDQPHYVVVDRNKQAIIDSLEWREGKADGHWSWLVDYYLDQREFFLSTVKAPRVRLEYERLTHPDTALDEVWKLVDFLAMDAIQPRLVGRYTSNVIHLGDVARAHPPEVRVVHAWNSGEEWRSIRGEVHGVVVADDANPDELEGWVSKVRPGGFVEGRNLLIRRRWAPTTWSVTTSASGYDRMERRDFLQRGEPFGTVGIGVPYFKASYEFWRWWSWILWAGLEPGDGFLNNETVMAPLPIPVVHNRLMARFLETDKDCFCIVEDDHVGDYDVIRRMRQKRENWDFDIVTANYVNRREQPWIVGYELAAKPNRHGEYICIIDHADIWKTGTQPVDGSVMGLALIRRWVLDAMLGGRNPKDFQWSEWVGGNSQDIQFYGKARDVGARVGVDRDANIGHVTQTIRTVDDFWRMREGKHGNSD